MALRITAKAIIICDKENTTLVKDGGNFIGGKIDGGAMSEIHGLCVRIVAVIKKQSEG